ncbi:hypothetical protein MU582_13630 [Nocardioidaceae bacterium SCSIO 66511]|nr:hypothetical protein MU582_13630 [Nocardioidaceae bacterium SCSIO 66511]
MSTRSVPLFAAVAGIALSGSTFVPADAAEEAVSSGERDGWVEVDSNDIDNTVEAHALDDGTLVAVGESSMHVRRPRAQLWKARLSTERCSVEASRTSHNTVFVSLHCWDKFDSWNEVRAWTASSGWSSGGRVAKLRASWAGYGGAGGVARRMRTVTGKWRTLPKLPFEPVAMAGTRKRHVLAVGNVKGRLKLSRWRSGHGWSKPQAVAKAKAAKSAQLAVTGRRGDVAVLVDGATYVRNATTKAWTKTPIRPPNQRRIVAQRMLVTGAKRFAVVWQESEQTEPGSYRQRIRVRDVTAGKAGGPIETVDTVDEDGSQVLDPENAGWLDADATSDGAVVLGYTVFGDRVREAALQVRDTEGAWSGRSSLSIDEAARSRVATNSRGCMVGLADIGPGIDATASPVCAVAHPTPTDERTQLDRPTAITGAYDGYVRSIDSATTPDRTRHLAFTTTKAPDSGSVKRIYLTTRADDGTNGPVSELTDPSDTYDSCQFTDPPTTVGESAYVAYVCGKPYHDDSSATYELVWSPASGWSDPRPSESWQVIGAYRGKVLVETLDYDYALVDVATGERTTFPSPPMEYAELTVEDDEVLATTDDSYATYDPATGWSGAHPSPLADANVTDWAYDGGTLLAGDYSGYRILRPGEDWTPEHKVHGDYPELQVLSDGNVVAMDQVDCTRGQLVRLRRIDLATGDVSTSSTDTACAPADQWASHLYTQTGEDGDLYARTSSPYFHYDNVYYLPSVEGDWSSAYADDEVATGFAGEVSASGDREFDVTSTPVPYLGKTGLAVWDFGQ